ncbi:hypothetical protein CWI39_3397p0010 [Hamiltosporidium magnivora]|uniref:Uncharacterized protein n=1 Tax=Hamiltosporidium magnivora TaxID=148818 RepID=A0A4Q9KQ82_9MICR|nr:hypothetical protein CWI39_3397p0010 [Hamiltosporidium magnivora]
MAFLTNIHVCDITRYQTLNGCYDSFWKKEVVYMTSILNKNKQRYFFEIDKFIFQKIHYKLSVFRQNYSIFLKKCM